MDRATEVKVSELSRDLRNHGESAVIRPEADPHPVEEGDGLEKKAVFAVGGEQRVPQKDIIVIIAKG